MMKVATKAQYKVQPGLLLIVLRGFAGTDFKNTVLVAV
jgi:hypothetical protein